MVLLKKVWKPVFLGLFVFASAFAQTNTNALKFSNLKPISILVESVSDESPLSTEELESRTRLRLRRNGISVVPSNATNKYECSCFLYVNLNVIELNNASGGDLDEFAYDLEIKFTRGDLVAEGVGAVVGAVWQKSWVGYSTSSSRFRKDIPETLDSMLDLFSIEFIETNDL
tara:strand:+ start:332 stop:847 length:516 start_codon:yes stop_codon:yes gene_type:complete